MSVLSRWAATRWAWVPFGLKAGLLVALSFLANEFLMGVTPKTPLPWAVPYFPIRTIGIGLVGGAVIVAALVRLARQRSPRAAVDLAVALPITGAVVWFNYAFRGLIFFDLWQR